VRGGLGHPDGGAAEDAEGGRADVRRTPRYSNRTLFRRLFAQTRGERKPMLALFGVELLATPAVLLSPVPLAIAVDDVIGSGHLPGVLDSILPGFITSSDLGILAFAAFLQIFVVLLTQLQESGWYVLNTVVGERLTISFRARLFDHVQRLSLRFHDRRDTHDSIYRIQYDAQALQHVTEAAFPFVSSTLTLVAALYVTVQIDWVLALVAFGVIPILFLLIRGYEKRVRPRYSELKEPESGALGVVQEVLTTVRVVKAFGREDREQDRFIRQSRNTMRARIRLAYAEGGFGLLVNLTTGIGTAAVLYIGVRQVQSGALTVGGLIIVMNYLLQLYGPLETISEKVADLQSGLASAERAFALFDESPEVEDLAHGRRLARCRGAVEFRDVSFAYDESHPVLRDVSFAIEPGTRLGIAGPTGAGKTTLVSLITRFYDPVAGHVLLDGVDLREYRLADLRRQFAIVLQEPVLFSTTIAENIAYADPDAAQSAIVTAAQAANAHDFITALPEGYATPVGERGMLLSGGERQRIALARAFLKDAPLLILDEPTSSVDVTTEAAIMDAMERLMQGRTTFMIAHRLSTLDICDARLELEGGRIVDASGLAEELPAPR
jgi:ATP-binding cassette subfamily B protein